MSNEMAILLCKWLDTPVSIVGILGLLLCACGMCLAAALLLVPRLRLANVRFTLRQRRPQVVNAPSALTGEPIAPAAASAVRCQVY